MRRWARCKINYREIPKTEAEFKQSVLELIKEYNE